ncbi:zinc finger BED domain-containing protein 1-like [Ctenocephalides felis]|uniref:zinc finger BED domain-containing protein 1-like n=1 Tax=Ctenocephalides felis TaxID=7515 RepID=UPI000E6E406B|nr:zinc finger BED domain-containing protein 1-like [Ctenocephalides felis]
MTVTSYLGVTAHYLQEDKLVSRCIATVALDQRHTGDFIAEKLKEICAGIHISSLDKITAVVTDNHSNMIAGIANILEKNKHLPCFAHTITLIAESPMSVNDLGALVSKVRDVVKFFKSSVILSDSLRQKQTGSQPLKLILDVKTLWNSVYYMLQRYVELAPIVHQILMLNTKAPPTPSAVEMQNIKTLMCILKPLEYVTKELSGEQYVTISKIIPIVNCLKTQINNIPMAVGDGDGPHGRVIDIIKKEILKQIERRFGHIEDNYLIAMSCLLDPIYKNIHFQDANACAKAISLLRRYITTPPSVIGSDHDSDSSLETTYDFWSHHKKLAHTKKRCETSSSTQFEYKDEISHYLSTQVSPLSLNPLKQWEDLKVVFPKLYKLAREFLSIPATSVPSERLFSKAGRTITKTRNRLSPKRLDKLLFLSDCTEEEWDL